MEGHRVRGEASGEALKSPGVRERLDSEAAIFINGRDSFWGQKWALVLWSLWGMGINNSKSCGCARQENLFDGEAEPVTASLSSAAKSERAAESGQRAAREEMVLHIFNYMELIASAPWIYSKCAG